MSLRRNLPQSIALLFACAATTATVSATPGTYNQVQAVNTRIADDYVRTKLPNGQFQAETYAFGPGGYWRSGSSDKSIDQAQFLEVAHTLAGPLANQGYLPATDPKQAKLLIMVYWGVTESALSTNNSAAYLAAGSAFSALKASIAGAPPVSNNRVSPMTAERAVKQARGDVKGDTDAEVATDAAVQALHVYTRLRRQQDAENSKLLGYDDWWASTARFENTPFDTQRNDMLDELEDSRYFVVLMAYDFQLMWKQKQTKLLWETRFSINQRHNEFNKILPDMALFASKHFGRATHGLLRSNEQVGKVQLGELQTLPAASSEDVK